MASSMTLIDIANLAAVELGEAPISSFEDNTSFARAMKIIHIPIRDKFLRENNWNSATARVTLAASTDTPKWGFSTSYPLPADWLKLLEVRSQATNVYIDSTNVPNNIPYRLEGDDIICNETTGVQIRYVKRLTDVSRWDSMMVEALATLYAYKTAYTITKDAGLRAQLKAEYEQYVVKAGLADGFDDTVEDIPTDSWITVRQS